MIVDGVEYHQAAETARLLGVREATVREWARSRNDRPAKVRSYRLDGQGRGTVWYRLDECAVVERDLRLAAVGRPRVA